MSRRPVDAALPHRRWVLWRLVPFGAAVGVLDGAVFLTAWTADVGDAGTVAGLRRLGEQAYLSGIVAAPISGFVGVVSALLLAEYLFQLLGEQDSVDLAIGRVIRRATAVSAVLVPGALVVVSLAAGSWSPLLVGLLAPVLTWCLCTLMLVRLPTARLRGAAGPTPGGAARTSGGT